MKEMPYGVSSYSSSSPCDFFCFVISFWEESGFSVFPKPKKLISCKWVTVIQILSSNEDDDLKLVSQFNTTKPIITLIQLNQPCQCIYTCCRICTSKACQFFTKNAWHFSLLTKIIINLLHTNDHIVLQDCCCRKCY